MEFCHCLSFQVVMLHNDGEAGRERPAQTKERQGRSHCRDKKQDSTRARRGATEGKERVAQNTQHESRARGLGGRHEEMGKAVSAGAKRQQKYRLRLPPRTKEH